jgi:hypothetical protein
VLVCAHKEIRLGLKTRMLIYGRTLHFAVDFFSKTQWEENGRLMDRVCAAEKKRCACDHTKIYDEGQILCCRWRCPPLAPRSRSCSHFAIGVRPFESRREVAVALVTRVRAQRKQITRRALTRNKA